ncbi:MAG: hypothetical protein SGPRY_006157 [Prymnesium sp.]
MRPPSEPLAQAVFLLGRSPTVHKYIVSMCHSAAEAPGLISRLCKRLLSEGSHLSLLDGVLALESPLYDRIAILEEAISQPHATAYTVVEAILKEKPAEASEGVERPGAGIEGDSLSRVSLEAAAMRLAFRELAKALHDAGADTLREKIQSLAIGFDGRCPIAIRALCSKRIVSKHPVLISLFDLRAYIPEYLTWALTANTAGVIPARLSRYSIRGEITTEGKHPAEGLKFVEHLLSFDFAEADWVNSPGGLSALYKAKKGFL